MRDMREPCRHVLWLAGVEKKARELETMPSKQLYDDL